MAKYGKPETIEFLNNSGVTYEILEHEPVYTIEEMESAGICAKGGIVKNLFLRDQKGKKHYLVVAPEDKKINMAELADKIGSTKLSFASAERLEKYLGVAQGSVTPLAVLNDENREVVVCFDEDIRKSDRIGIHPNENTATVWMDFDDLVSIIEKNGNRIKFFK